MAPEAPRACRGGNERDDSNSSNSSYSSNSNDSNMNDDNDNDDHDNSNSNSNSNITSRISVQWRAWRTRACARCSVGIWRRARGARWESSERPVCPCVSVVYINMYEQQMLMF